MAEVINKRKKAYLNERQANQNRRQTNHQNHKWGMGNTRQNLKNEFVTVQKQKVYMRALKEGKYFRCLSTTHKKIHCREPIRCFKCGKLGHIASMCRFINAKNKEPIKTNPL